MRMCICLSTSVRTCLLNEKICISYAKVSFVMILSHSYLCILFTLHNPPGCSQR